MSVHIGESFVNLYQDWSNWGNFSFLVSDINFQCLEEDPRLRRFLYTYIHRKHVLSIYKN